MKIKAKKTFISGAIYANAGDTIETSDQVGGKLVGLDLAEAIAEARPSQEAKPKPMTKKAAR